MTSGKSNVCRRQFFAIRLILIFGTILFSSSLVEAASERGSAASSLLDGVSEGIGKMKSGMGETFNDVYESVEDLIEQSTLAGRIRPILGKFMISKSQWQAIFAGVSQVAQISDILFLLAIGYLLVPIVEKPYNALVPSAVTRPFKQTKRYDMVETIAHLAQLALLVYCVDIIKIILVGIGFTIPRGDRISHAFSYVVYCIYFAKRVSKFKKYSIKKWSRKTSKNQEEGHLKLLNRLIDTVIYGLACFLILDILNVELGFTMQGVAAISSLGALTFSLASKGLATNWLYGIMLSASDRIYEGDSILLNKSKFSGNVVKLGWVETVIRSSDDVLVTLPNSELVSQQVSNLSRINICQVKQTLKLNASDASKVPALLDDIKCEIRTQCPAVITDGSRPFRATWTSMENNKIEIVVDAHFRIKPVGDSYWKNRQTVLQAIDQAAKNSGVSFV
jgi:small-conductance mechanosensitive channel